MDSLLLKNGLKPVSIEFIFPQITLIFTDDCKEDHFTFKYYSFKKFKLSPSLYDLFT